MTLLDILQPRAVPQPQGRQNRTYRTTEAHRRANRAYYHRNREALAAAERERYWKNKA